MTVEVSWQTVPCGFGSPPDGNFSPPPEAALPHCVNILIREDNVSPFLIPNEAQELY